MSASMSLSDLFSKLSTAEPRCLARYSRHASSVTLLLKLSRKNASFNDPFLLLTILPLPVFLFFSFLIYVRGEVYEYWTLFSRRLAWIGFAGRFVDSKDSRNTKGKWFVYLCFVSEGTIDISCCLFYENIDHLR